MSIKLNKLVEKKVGHTLRHLNTLMLCRVVQVVPYIEIISYFDAKYLDGDTNERTKIQKPITMQGHGASFKVDDIVLAGFLQEFVEGGAMRKFDISDAVIIGKVSL